MSETPRTPELDEHSRKRVARLLDVLQPGDRCEAEAWPNSAIDDCLEALALFLVLNTRSASDARRAGGTCARELETRVNSVVRDSDRLYQVRALERALTGTPQ